MEKVPINTIWEEDETMSQEETEQATVVRAIEMPTLHKDGRWIPV